MEKLFQRHDLISCEALVKGNLCTATSHQNYHPCKITFAQFTNKESKQRIFCLLLLETEVVCIINPLLDVNPKPYDPKLAHKFKPNQLVISKVDGKYCAIKCSEKVHFNRLQALLCDALAEAICCDSMKPLQSGRLSATRLTRCLNTCKLLTRDVALVQQVSRLKSIRRQINNTLQAINGNQCVIPSPEVRKVRAGCDFIQRIYPTFRCDPDLQFLTEQLRGGKHSTEDLESICKLLLQVEHEDKTEFVRMVRAFGSITLAASKENTAPETVTQTMTTSKKHVTQQVLLSPSKRIVLTKKVSWDSSIRSNEKNVRQSRKTSRQSTPKANSPRRPTGIKTQPEELQVVVKEAIVHTSVTADIASITTPTKSKATEVVLTATPIPPAILHARVVSPSKRTQVEKPIKQQRAKWVPNLNLLVLICVVIVGICCAYRSWPHYSALTFSTPHGVTTVSISVSSAMTSHGPNVYDTSVKHNVTRPAASEQSHTATVTDSGSLEEAVFDRTRSVNKKDDKSKTGALAINVAYAEKMKLKSFKCTLRALSKILLSPVKFVKALFRNAVRLFGHLKGAKRILA